MPKRTQYRVARPVGRPPTGLRAGERLMDYKRLTVRLPDDVREELAAASGALGVPEWRVLIDAIRAYVGNGPSLSDSQRRVIRSIVKMRSVD